MASSFMALVPLHSAGTSDVGLNSISSMAIRFFYKRREYTASRDPASRSPWQRKKGESSLFHCCRFDFVLEAIGVCCFAAAAASASRNGGLLPSVAHPLSASLPHKRIEFSAEAVCGFDPRFARLVTSRLQMPILRAASPGSSAAVATGCVDATWDALDGVRVFAAGTGEPVFLRDLCDQNEGVAVVALMRHFGCFCWS